VKTPPIPAFVGDVKTVVNHIMPNPSVPLEFRTNGLAQPHDVTLVPFYRILDQRYNVYWSVYSPDEWRSRTAAAATMAVWRRGLVDRTIDLVTVANAEHERAHNLTSEGATDGFFEGQRTREARNGWFSYALKVTPTSPTSIVCAYRGSEGRRRAFDILVDGQKIASETLEYHPTEQLDKEYAIPESLTRSKTSVTIRFQAQTDSTAGALIEVRTIQSQ